MLLAVSSNVGRSCTAVRAAATPAAAAVIRGRRQERGQQNREQHGEPDDEGGQRSVSGQDRQGETSRQQQRRTPSRTIAPAHDGVPGERQPGGADHGAQVLGMRGEESGELIDRGAEERGRSAQPKPARQQVSEDAASATWSATLHSSR